MSEAQEIAVYYRHFDLPANFPVIAMLGDKWVSRPEPIRWIHFHNCLEIGFLFEGSGLFYIDGETVPVEGPCVTVIPQNVRHLVRSAEGSLCHWNWLFVDPAQLDPNMDSQTSVALNRLFQTLSAADCVFPAGEYPQVYALMEMILWEMGADLPFRQDLVRGLLSGLFLLLLRRGGSSVSSRPVRQGMTSIEPAISYIADNYMHEISVGTLAELCHVSQSHFRRLFKQVLGWAPQEYLETVRVARACAMLYNGDRSVTEIAAGVGFPSPSSFNRQFRRIYHMSPSQWRRKMRGEKNPAVTAYFDVSPATTMQFVPREGGAREAER
ncbi:MAG: AraC family transcriptional regulator [Clostridia bacterium]|nr:AraC family transcriptional regulator [Clostridia bacterium]